MTQASGVDPIDTRPQPRSVPARTSRRRTTQAPGGDGLIRALGWFSVGLGLTRLLAPRALGRALGVRTRPERIRALGLRELSSGLGILLHGHSAWAKSRVAGDVMDLALLARAASDRRSDRGRLALASTAVLGVTALDVIASRTHAPQVPVPIIETIAIKRSPEELYRFFRDVQNLPPVVRSLESVQALDANRSHWVARPLPGVRLEWEAELAHDEPDRKLGWRVQDGSDLPHYGQLSFSALPGDRGTLVKLELEAVGGRTRAARKLAKALGDATGLRLKNDLRRVKQWLEVGEVATTEGQSSGRRSAISRLLP